MELFSDAFRNVLGWFGEALAQGCRGQQRENIVGTVLGALTITPTEVADLRRTLRRVKGDASSTPVVDASSVTGLATVAQGFVHIHHERLFVVD
jgi:hypothetical protein